MHGTLIFIIPRRLCLGVSDHTSPWGRSELLFRNSGWGKIQNFGFGPKAKMIPIAIGTAKYLYGSASRIVGFKKFFILTWVHIKIFSIHCLLLINKLLLSPTIDIFINNFTTKDMNWKTVVTSTESFFGTPDSYRERSHIYWPGAGCAI